MLIGFYDYTVILTYLGLASSLIGMAFSVSGDFRAAFICLMISGLCDMFDGKIARTKKDRSDEAREFGIQIDSLCDLVCFGVFPAILVNNIVTGAGWNVGVHWIVKLGGVLLVLAGVIRLGYFNVTEHTRQQETTESRKYYQGLPITTSALAFPLIYSITNIMDKDIHQAGIAFVAAMFLLAIFFVWDIRVRKPGTKGIIVLSIVGLLVLVGMFV